jgi:fructokinase
VLGGGLSNIESLYDQGIEALGQHIFSDTMRTRVVKNKHGDSSGVRGAAWLWDVL